MAAPDLKLGLIGDNITRSRSPLLHQLAGQQNGMNVVYERLVPLDMGEDFDSVFAACAGRGYRGINVTYPYKERAAKKVVVSEPLVQAIGAVNTVLFEPDGPRGFNTDYSGFIAAYRDARAGTPPGIVCLIGTGGVGRAIAFALVSLGAEEIRLVDRDASKAESLAADLESLNSQINVNFGADADKAARGAQGLLNGTPVGMVGHEGIPLTAPSMAGAKWAFDAVYIPKDTEFLRTAEAWGLETISGHELFFWQGVHAWRHFAGKPLDAAALRTAIAEEHDIG